MEKPKFKAGDWVIHTGCEEPEASEIFQIRDNRYYTCHAFNEWYSFTDNAELRIATPNEILQSQGVDVPTKPSKSIRKRDIIKLMNQAWMMGFQTQTSGSHISIATDTEELYKKYFENN